MSITRIGIIDIGSNSVRLVVYERTPHGANRVIEGSKRQARLSEQIDDQGRLAEPAVAALAETLRHFKLLCAHQHTDLIRAVATAAIRNASNRRDILQRIEAETGLRIELLSGEQEARLGFLGMINSMDLTDGFLIDIGGGSTELSLFRERELVDSVSFPFGCVNMARRYTDKGMLDGEGLSALQRHVAEALQAHPWTEGSRGLPLVAVGGTARALGKVEQASVDYPFQQTHNYPLKAEQVDARFEELRGQPLDKRKKTPGLSKGRVDLIVPGLAVLRTVYRAIGASGYVICGAGLRDGLIYTCRYPQQPLLDDVLAYSVDNLAALHPEAPQHHVERVSQHALSLFDALAPLAELPARARILLDAASRLHRIGASIDYYNYAPHSFYLIVNSHLNGLSHREILMTAAIASYRNKGKARKQLAEYKALLQAGDMELIARLGALLLLAVALDRSETQALRQFRCLPQGDKLDLQVLMASGPLEVERLEVDDVADDVHKAWNLTPRLLEA
ncbi:Ppx/GppA family phosphatase [Paenibacillus sp. IB182496]|uniref:Ppx/GppA family phosphatase n=1 Tax=Paenibacillus sabuli TaxID=2772509 RepID=A0A927BSL0_9BACL|nr:Ppx/GppA phosphatase family protein [Paenibacillus sabuli]MBD2844673.1 Ppx/GppA family phosphatase [Paenibacillus sabuli]